MKEFLKTNTVTYNLMSFTGFKSIIIFALLTESPKSYKEIQDYIRGHEYIHEELSTDSLRIYLNSLKDFGCKIAKINDNGTYKYQILSHPFQLKLDDKHVKSLIKIYKAISKSIDISDLIELQEFFDKFSKYVENEDLKIKLKNISPISNIDIKLIKNLRLYAQKNVELTIYYNSPNSGRKNITVLIDKINVKNGKLYIYGVSSEHKNYSQFLVSRIIKIVSINFSDKTLTSPDYTIGYEYLKEENEKFETLPNEKIISSVDNKLVVEITSKSKFEIMQRVMYLTKRCKVLYPLDFQKEIVSMLKKMKEEYLEK